jgi:hypothetical protein
MAISAAVLPYFYGIFSAAVAPSSFKRQKSPHRKDEDSMFAFSSFPNQGKGLTLA